jgi:hypothetical protein
MTPVDEQRDMQSDDGRALVRNGRWARIRSRLQVGISLRAKLVLPVLAIACLAVGALFAFAYVSLRASIESIYEARARSVAAVISKSIEEKDYILYYSDELDHDIARLLEQYESILGITVIGATSRGCAASWSNGHRPPRALCFAPPSPSAPALSRPGSSSSTCRSTKRRLRSGRWCGSSASPPRSESSSCAGSSASR